MTYVLVLYLSVGIWIGVRAFFTLPHIPVLLRMLFLTLFVPVWPVAVYAGIKKGR